MFISVVEWNTLPGRNAEDSDANETSQPEPYSMTGDEFMTSCEVAVDGTGSVALYWMIVDWSE